MSTIMVEIVKPGSPVKRVGATSGQSINEILSDNGFNPGDFHVRTPESPEAISLSTRLYEDSVLVLSKNQNIVGGQ